MINYVSTRGHGPEDFETVLLKGLAPDGGLYIPDTWPQIDLPALKDASYQNIAEAVMYPFVEGCIPRTDFRTIINDTYNKQIFRHPDVTPLKSLYPDLYLLELFHGPTIAFKDIALQLLGRLFDYVLHKKDQSVTIVGATSGDTGSAAIEGCRHSDRANIFILHPHGRVSDVQRRQMTTVNAPNVHNIALEGTFDDCQSMVKAMFNDPDFRARQNLSAVNSINWARIMAQIVYYVATIVRLDRTDISFVVPTGNFGNIYAAYAAKQMGLPIKTLAIATNRNDILTRFFETGTMRMEGVTPTLSPSMDIQISSNFERYLFDTLDRDPSVLTRLMQEFSQNGSFNALGATSTFKAFRADDVQTIETIRTVYNNTGYTLDPHTAVGVFGALKLKDNIDGPIVSLACAHPAKFPDAAQQATGEYPNLPDHLAHLFDLEEHVHVLPNDLKTVKSFINTHQTILSSI